MITAAQKKTCQHIIQIFETGKVSDESYGTVTLLKGDTGRLTVGLHQTTIATGNLYFMTKAYVDAKGKFAEQFKPYLQVLKEKRIICDTDKNLHALYKKAGDDPIMRETQDKFFDRVYWDTAVEIVAKLGFIKPLSFAIVYDSVVHGSWKLIAQRTKDKVHLLNNVSERLWIETYVTERAKWISTHSNTLLRKTIYRMNEFKRLIAEARWELALPMTIRGVTLRPDALAASETAPVERASADEIASRVLWLKQPNMSGADVIILQEGLVRHRFLDAEKADGIFGPSTDRAVRAYQSANGLTVDGQVGMRTMAKITL